MSVSISHVMNVRSFRMRGEFDDVDRTVEAVLATDAIVTVFDLATWEPVDEVLVMDGWQPCDQCVLLDSHPQKERGEILSSDVHGSARNLRVEDGKLLGKLHFAADPASVSLWAKVRGRHVRDLSIGTIPIEQTMIPRGQTQTVAGRSYTASRQRELLITTKWMLGEVSVCPHGADPQAKIRSTRSRSMIQATRHWNDFFSDRGNIRAAASHVEGLNALANVVGATILEGYRSAIDTTRGWTRDVPLPNFKPVPLHSVQGANRMRLHARGGQARAEILRVQSEEWQLARWSLQFKIGEEDLRDVEELQLLRIALLQAGAAAAALRPDMVYSHILSNPPLVDDVALFHTDRGNLGAATAFSGGTLGTGMAAICGQTLEDQTGEPFHQNLIPNVLIVPPAHYYSARLFAREFNLGDDRDLVVHSESRLSTTPMVDPRNDTDLVAGNGTNWLLAADEGQAPSIVVGNLDGRTEPIIDHWELDRGEWGLAFDVRHDIAVAAVDGRPLYFAVGQE